MGKIFLRGKKSQLCVRCGVQGAAQAQGVDVDPLGGTGGRHQLGVMEATCTVQGLQACQLEELEEEKRDDGALGAL